MDSHPEKTGTRLVEKIVPVRKKGKLHREFNRNSHYNCFKRF
jgi:hypothetical protein